MLLFFAVFLGNLPLILLLKLDLFLDLDLDLDGKITIDFFLAI